MGRGGTLPLEPNSDKLDSLQSKDLTHLKYLKIVERIHPHASSSSTFSFFH